MQSDICFQSPNVFKQLRKEHLRSDTLSVGLHWSLLPSVHVLTNVCEPEPHFVFIDLGLHFLDNFHFPTTLGRIVVVVVAMDGLRVVVVIFLVFVRVMDILLLSFSDSVYKYWSVLIS